MMLFTASSLFSLELTSRTQMLMGTFITITLEPKDYQHIEEGFLTLKEVEHSLSSYDKNALVYKLNHHQKITPTSYLNEALSLSEKYYHDSNGYFTINVGSITKGVYHFGENERVPTSAELDRTILEGTIDLGGMGKGYGVDKVKQVYFESNISNGTVAASGDIFCFHKCEIAIQNPFDENIELTLKMKNRNSAISTSGNYRRYIKSKENNHLINPKKKRPAKTFASITLLTTTHSNSDIDAYATAASVMPLAKALQFLKRLELGYILILNNKKRIYSSNLDIYVEDFLSPIKTK